MKVTDLPCGPHRPPINTGSHSEIPGRMTNATNTAPAPSGGRLLMLAGLVVPLLGVAAYAVQLSLERLMLPWYMPAAALVGVALVVASLWKRWTLWRVLALVVVALLGGFELMAYSTLRLPPYTGPIAVGSPFPAFEARRADGRPFTQNDLIGDQHHALVFFRGRW
jgi:hypothetical protein